MLVFTYRTPETANAAELSIHYGQIERKKDGCVWIELGNGYQICFEELDLDRFQKVILAAPFLGVS